MGTGWHGNTWLSTFPELVWRSVQNLVEIGPAVHARNGPQMNLTVLGQITSQDL